MVSFEKIKSAPPLRRFTRWCHTQSTHSASWLLTVEGAASPLLPWLQRQVWLFTFSVTRKDFRAEFYIQNESCSHQVAESVNLITYHGLQKSLDMLYCYHLSPVSVFRANAGLFHPVRGLGTLRAPPGPDNSDTMAKRYRLQMEFPSIASPPSPEEEIWSN